jgi:carbamoyl-phosphate synthase large subunit
VERERPRGVIVQFGGQTPLKLVVALEKAGVPILGTPPDAIDRAEDRRRFAALIEDLGLAQAPGGTARSYEEAARIAATIGYPALVRPSYVLGGRAMQIVYDEEDLRRYMTEAVRVSPEHPILVDKFLEDALEIDVDAIADRERVVVGGVMEHVEKASVHSGDSACALPPYSLGDDQVERIVGQTRALARECGRRGLGSLPSRTNRSFTVSKVSAPRAASVRVKARCAPRLTRHRGECSHEAQTRLRRGVRSNASP